MHPFGCGFLVEEPAFLLGDQLAKHIEPDSDGSGEPCFLERDIEVRVNHW